MLLFLRLIPPRICTLSAAVTRSGREWLTCFPPRVRLLRRAQFSACWAENSLRRRESAFSPDVFLPRMFLRGAKKTPD
jgi:hypothetical protein